MAQRHEGRMAASIEGDFVVFLIGARILQPWKVWAWWPIKQAMERMISELQADPESGFLGVETYGAMNGVLIQYWRSFEHLERYARVKDREHFPAWVDFNKRIQKYPKAIGIWHETYAVPAGSYEAIYRNCPAMGLGKAGDLIPAAGRSETAAGRIGADERSYPEAADVGIR